MSKISQIVKPKMPLDGNDRVINFMGGISYEINPLDTLKMISASSIFGEPQYYRESGLRDRKWDGYSSYVSPYAIFKIEHGETASDLMIKAIWDSLDYDFKATIDWANELRNDYFMRINPQLIMVLAALHPLRAKFDKNNPRYFRKLNNQVMRRADEPSTQLALYLYLKGDKRNLPSILKRSWADKIEGLSSYEIAKYKSAEVGLIDTIRICHAHNTLIGELLQNGSVKVENEDKTWENLRSEGKTFKEILNTIQIPHMALLRNLRNIFSELNEQEDVDMANNILTKLLEGVKHGKQFPFRYYQAYKIISSTHLPFQNKILETLEKCIDVSIQNMPKLKGKTICLSDNSGSAWGTFNSEYGKMTVANIDNLSSVITAMCSDDGYVGKFGNKLIYYPISQRNGALAQAEHISNNEGRDVGYSTENGIWLFFQEAIEKKEVYDNIFIYSDMQAGHGGLYGLYNNYIIEGTNYGDKDHINVMKLIDAYRKKVNPKVNVFCVQTAGYNNVLIPEYTYRGAVLYGWTGKEASFAKELIDIWNDIEDE